MKTTVVLTALLTGTLLTTNLWGQRATSAAEEKKAETKEQEILRRWAEAEERIRERRWRFEMTTKDRTFNQETVTKGQGSLKKPDLFRVDFQYQDGGMEKIVLGEGGRLHQFDFRQKCEQVYRLPQDLSLGLLRLEGYRPAERTTRFLFFFEINWEMLNQEFSWAVLGPQSRALSSLFNVHLIKDDRSYIYLEVTPKDSEDKKCLNRARVVLHRDSYQVRQCWWEFPNDNTVTLDYLDVQTNPQPPITRESLLQDLPSQGWSRRDFMELEKKAAPSK